MDSAQSAFIQKYTGAVVLVGKAETIPSDLLNDRSSHRDSVRGSPVLSFNTPFFLSSDFDQMFAAAATAVVAVPVLDDGKVKIRLGHGIRLCDTNTKRDSHAEGL